MCFSQEFAIIVLTKSDLNIVYSIVKTSPMAIFSSEMSTPKPTPLIGFRTSMLTKDKTNIHCIAFCLLATGSATPLLLIIIWLA